MNYDDYLKLSEDDKQLYDLCADYRLANPIIVQPPKNVKYQKKVNKKDVASNKEHKNIKLNSIEKKILLELISHKQISILCRNHMDYNSKKYTELESLKIKVNDLCNK